MKKKVVIVGLGYVGLPLALSIAGAKRKREHLYNVVGLEKDNFDGKKKVKNINRCNILNKSADSNLKKKLIYHKKVIKNFFASDDFSHIKDSNIVVVTISCHLLNNKKYKIDFKKYVQTIEKIVREMKKNSTLVVESTLLPGTSEKIFKKIIKSIEIRKFKKGTINYVYSYERVMPGKNYLNSIINYWRVVSGISERSYNIGKKFYSSFVNTKKYPITRLSCTEAEIAKIIENSYRAVNIAFVNEWQKFCENYNANLFKIVEAIRMRPTHNNLRYPGFGVGGYCLTKDPLYGKISSKILLNKKTHFPFSELAMKINKKMPFDTLNLVKKVLKKKIENNKILLMGYSYKENIADIRFSPSIKLHQALNKSNTVEIYDPYFNDSFSLKKFPEFSKYNIIFFLVKHSTFKKINFLNKISKKSVIVDANNVLSKKQTKDIEKIAKKLISIGK